MRQLGEALAQNIASRVGVDSGDNIKQVDLLRELDYTLKLDPQVKDAFHAIRKYGNAANHDFTKVAQWFTNHPGLGELLDTKLTGIRTKPIIISDHEDEVIDVKHGYGDGQKPEDYLQAFNDFVNANSNRLVALQIVIQRPWELTRQSLKELAIELEKNHFREADLRTAWHEVKNEEITARIIGFIRQAAVGEVLMSFEQRVENALSQILASQQWKTPQKQWLEAIAKQMKATTIVDNKALNEGVFKSQLGGLRRANKLFDPPITDVLTQFNKALWQTG